MKTQNELQDQKSRSYELKRAFDVLKTDYEVMFKSHQREIGALKEQHEQVETKQREEMTKMYEREISPEKDEQVSFKYLFLFTFVIHIASMIVRTASLLFLLDVFSLFMYFIQFVFSIYEFVFV
jgi:hypothetical protein